MEIAFIIGIVVVALFALFIARKPNSFSYESAVVIAAPPEAIFPHVNNQHKWIEWSPYAKMDPDAKVTFTGPDAGVGAQYSWIGNKTGEGTSTITQSRPYDFIQFRLDFRKPMKATNTVEFTFIPQGTSTNVTWKMHGPNNFVGKILGIFINCEKMCTDQFSQGLESLRGIVESERKAA